MRGEWDKPDPASGRDEVLADLDFLGLISAVGFAAGLGVLNIQRRIFKSQGSRGGSTELVTGGGDEAACPCGGAEEAGAVPADFAGPLRRRSNSFRAEAQRFKCLATRRRSLAETVSAR